MGVWGTSLMVLGWFVYLHTMMVPGYVDRTGRFKGTVCEEQTLSRRDVSRVSEDGAVAGGARGCPRS